MIPRSAATAIIGTAIGVILLLSFKTPPSTRTVAGANAALSTPAPSASPLPSTAASDTSSPSPTASATPSSSGLKDGQYVGQDVITRYGDVQVKVIVSGSRITDVQALQLPFDLQRSNEISQIAGPMLHDEVLQVQSAQIDTISGATYTSDAYAQSAQVALDQART